jgi:hypothetical protein
MPRMSGLTIMCKMWPNFAHTPGAHHPQLEPGTSFAHAETWRDACHHPRYSHSGDLRTTCR